MTKYSDAMVLDSIGSKNILGKINRDEYDYETNRKGNTDWVSYNGINMEGMESEKWFEGDNSKLENEYFNSEDISSSKQKVIDGNKKISLAYGCSPVVNPPWQFGELDDVRSNPNYPYMGRVYLEQILVNFPIMTVEPGREKYCRNPLTFFGVGLGAGGANNYIKSNGKEGLFAGLTNAIGVIGMGLSTIWQGLFGGDPDAEKFLRFQPSMKMFKKYVNDILTEVAGNLGMLFLGNSLKESLIKLQSAYSNADDEPPPSSDSDKTTGRTSDEQKKAKEFDEIFTDSGDKGTDPNAGFDPDAENKSSAGFAVRAGDEKDLQMILDNDKTETRPYKGTIPRLSIINFLPDYSRGGIMALADKAVNNAYIPFLIQKTTITETFGNETSPHPLGTQLNSQAEEAQNNNNFGMMNSMILNAAGQGGNFQQMAEGALKNLMLKLGGEVVAQGAEMGMILNGAGRAVFPNMWSNSSFQRSYSIEIPLWCPVGDIVSVFETVYMPMLIWFCLSTPLQNARNLYTSPFVVRVNAKGLFSIPFGIVETLQVSRGEEKNDRTINSLPRTMKLSISIKDLQPLMMLTMGGGTWWKLKKNNSGLTEYLATITGMSIADRQSLVKNLERFIGRVASNIMTAFSMNNIKYNISQAGILKPYLAISRALGGVKVDETRTFNTI